ncbi:MAG: N-acetylmuramoyl-L-alanine amidase [Paracoccaceae bacterium]
MRAIWAAVVLFGLSVAALAQDLSGLARLDPERTTVAMSGKDVVLRLGLSQPVPWRVRLLDDPPRMVVDFREVDFTGIDQVAYGGVTAVADLRAGSFRPGWSRLVVELAAPMIVSRAGMLTGDAVAVELTLTPADPAQFAAQAALPEPAEWALPTPADVPVLPPRGDGPLIVVLDPGHGGIDPGAERDGYSEADLMLTFARELKDLLLREGFEVVLTREEDVFVPLETRSSIARSAGAHVFISLHADALEEGEAVGATIYTLSDEASDAASQALAERHDRDDLLAGIDLSAQDDVVASVLMDMARSETEPRTDRLALALETAIKGAELRMHRHPQQEAGFSVLKAPDIPSVLVELGFLSSDRDLARLQNKDWRSRMAEAMVTALQAWAAEDAAIAALRKQ